MDLPSLATAFAHTPHVNLVNVMHFLKYASLAKATIEWGTKNKTRPPADLPTNVQHLLAHLIHEDVTLIQVYWDALKDYVWKQTPLLHAGPQDIQEYNTEALPMGTSYKHLFPPSRVCLQPACENHRTPDNVDLMTLTHPTTHHATLFTLREGTLPIFTTSLYCRACHTRYHHNYWVHKESSARHYYSGVPQYIQTSMYYFLDSALLEFFATSNTFGWVSSMNGCRIYNISIGNLNAHILNNQQAYIEELKSLHSNPPSIVWPCSLELGGEFLLNGFFLYSLLLEKSEQCSTLFLPHDESSQRLRLRDALLERNKQMEGPGQEAYLHACDLCFFVFEGDDGELYKVQAVVCDGDSIGFPCCAVHNCKEPLVTLRHRFCETHDHLTLQCAITTCTEPHEPQFRTCVDPSHRSIELSYFEKGKSLMQLRARLRQARGELEEPLDSEDSHPEVIVETTVCDEKSEAGNRTLKAYFGRRRTHNEQLIVRTCGVIIARATLYGSKAVSGVNEFAKATFPTPESTPEYFIFDNNCRLDLHQRAQGDTYFKDTGKPVDVFHFKSKHKVTDKHCQQHCNPAAFPELISNGSWRFNSSICEQVNGWLGEYLAIVRDMDPVRGMFYLDEMIKRKNRYVINLLASQGHNPWMIPASAVFPSLFE